MDWDQCGAPSSWRIRWSEHRGTGRAGAWGEGQPCSSFSVPKTLERTELRFLQRSALRGYDEKVKIRLRVLSKYQHNSRRLVGSRSLVSGERHRPAGAGCGSRSCFKQGWDGRQIFPPGLGLALWRAVPSYPCLLLLQHLLTLSGLGTSSGEQFSPFAGFFKGIPDQHVILCLQNLCSEEFNLAYPSRKGPWFFRGPKHPGRGEPPSPQRLVSTKSCISSFPAPLSRSLTRESVTTSGTEAWCRTTLLAVSVSCRQEGRGSAETGRTPTIRGKYELVQDAA